MIFDILWKSLRKALQPSWYDFLSYRVFGRKRNYEKTETYFDIVDHYKSHGLDFTGKSVIEAGSGLQLFTALRMLADGAWRVTLAEPKLKLTRDMLVGHIKAFNAAVPGTPLRIEDVEPRLHAYPDLSRIPADENGTADLICSFTVLEHVPDLKAFFRDSQRLLKPGGAAYHHVDLSDHTYQFFARFPLTAPLNSKRGLFHLRYSDRFFKAINDGKCYMNRVLLPEYLRMVRDSGLAITALEPQVFDGKVVIHPDLLRRAGKADAAELNTVVFSLALRK